MPLLPFIDYTFQQSVFGPLILADGQILPATLFSLDSTTIKSAIIQFSIVRDNATDTGILTISTDGVTTNYSIDSTNNTNLTGVTISAVQSGSNVDIQYVSTATGDTGEFTYIKTELTS